MLKCKLCGNCRFLPNDNNRRLKLILLDKDEQPIKTICGIKVIHTSGMSRLPYLAFHEDHLINSIIFPNDDTIFGGDLDDSYLTLYVETVNDVYTIHKGTDFTYFKILRDWDSVSTTDQLAVIHGFSGKLTVDSPDKHMIISYSYSMKDKKLPAYRTSTFRTDNSNELSIYMHQINQVSGTQKTNFGIEEITLVDEIAPVIIKPLGPEFKLDAAFHNKKTNHLERIGHDKPIEYIAVGA